MPAPPGTLGIYSIGAETGAVAATLAADSPLFSFRWGNRDNFAVLDYVAVSVAVSGAITTALVTGLEIVPARAFTASDSGGTALTPAGASNNDQKLKTNFSTSLVTDIRIATTGTLTAGTRTLDPFSIAQVLFGTGTAVGTTMLANTVLFDRSTNSYPFVMSQDEGFIIANPLAGPADGTFRVSVTVRWTEMSKQVF
jgi:hypothetical protein